MAISLSGDVSGADINLMSVASEKLGFSFRVRHATMWAAVVNGSYLGSVGMVQNKEAVVALGHMIVSEGNSFPGGTDNEFHVL